MYGFNQYFCHERNQDGIAIHNHLNQVVRNPDCLDCNPRFHKR